MITFLTGFFVGVVCAALFLAYAFTEKVKTHDYTFVIKDGRGRGEWVNRAEKYIDDFLEQNKNAPGQ